MFPSLAPSLWVQVVMLLTMQHEWCRMSTQQRCAATQRLIVDLEIMAQADYFVGSRTSGLFGIVSRMRRLLYNKSAESSIAVIAHGRK